MGGTATDAALEQSGDRSLSRLTTVLAVALTATAVFRAIDAVVFLRSVEGPVVCDGCDGSERGIANLGNGIPRVWAILAALHLITCLVVLLRLWRTRRRPLEERRRRTRLALRRYFQVGLWIGIGPILLGPWGIFAVLMLGLGHLSPGSAYVGLPITGVLVPVVISRRLQRPSPCTGTAGAIPLDLVSG